MRSSIQIGKYVLDDYHDGRYKNSLSITIKDDGEGGAFSLDDLEKMLDEFFEKKF